MQLDAIFTNGRFTTLDPHRPTAHTIGVFAGRVAALDEEVAHCTARQVHDLGGAPAVPGFNDAHQHLSMRGRRLLELDLRAEAAPTLDALYAAVAERAAELEPGAWIHGAGYDQNKLGAHPAAEALDAVAGGRPVWLEHVSCHMGVASTAAFELAGYPGRLGVPDPDGGHVERDAGGRATGLLQERAQPLVTGVFRPSPVEEIVTWIAAAGALGLSEGLTSFTEPGIAAVNDIGHGPVDLHAFQVAVERGLLKVRATVMPYLTVLHDLGVFEPGNTWFGLDLGLRSRFGDDRLKVGATKVATDGSLIGRSAHMCSGYHDEPDNSGFPLFDPDELRHMIVEAHRCGWQVAAHAIGDAAIDLALDAFAAAQAAHPRDDPRHRVEHFAVASDAQVERLAGLGAVAVPQGRFLTEIGDGMIAALGPERAARCYRMRSLLDAGAVMPGSSDAPVAHGSPLLNIHDMVNRRTASGAPLAPGEALTAEQALRAYTIGSAYAEHAEDRKGTLARGMLADFAVLSDDLLAVAPDRIASLSVGATVIGGEVVFDGGALT
ncbi:amidohydrolase [Nonomuraea sp. PA05]|uniref:amidohydrolase n=1 Tax=Nonomuraea sp. PA05 TaxID=2604466 RepID=UPI0011DA573B|nr:amidohydrolase [Nonomuraea sp. PA05]TYB51110.1 amidohydrolase [Nonomuraea sp. PA05]